MKRQPAYEHLEDTDLTWAFIVASVMLAQLRGQVGLETALSRLEMSRPDYVVWRNRLASFGCEMTHRLLSAEQKGG